jgi:hypothetical protein
LHPSPFTIHSIIDFLFSICRQYSEKANLEGSTGCQSDEEPRSKLRVNEEFSEYSVSTETHSRLPATQTALGCFLGSNAGEIF